MTALAELSDQVRACQACRLARGRTHAVPGSGSPQAEIMFIGEAPGYHEDQQGLPFVGAAGQFLDQLLAVHRPHARRGLYRQRGQVPAAR